MAAVTTPWGKATVLESVTVPQRAGEKRFAASFELLETQRGERIVRVAYSTDGRARRGPVSLRERDVKRLHAALVRAPTLREALLGEPPA